MLALINCTTYKVVATAKPPHACKRLSIYADLNRVPDNYIIVGVTIKDLRLSFTHEERLNLYRNITGDEIKRALADALDFQLHTRLYAIDPIKENLLTLEQAYEAKFKRKFKVSKKPRPEKKGSKPLPGSYARPKKGTATGTVWDICDELFKQSNKKIPPKEEVIALCTFEGINPSTAGTQYGKWKASL